MESQLVEDQRATAINRRFGRGKKPKNITPEQWALRITRLDDVSLERWTRPFRVTSRYFRLLRSAKAKRLEQLAERLPVWPIFGAPLYGFGRLGLAIIVGECGDLSNYANPAKVWKRLGLAPYLGKSGKQWRIEGGLSANQWAEIGYSPQRRSAMFTIGDSLLKKQNAYRELYLQRKEYERAKAPELPPMAHHRRAQRYVEKRLLTNLWRAWRGQSSTDTQHTPAPSLLAAQS